MKKAFFILFLFISFLFFPNSARAMELTKIGTLDITGDGIGSTVSAYTYPLRSFSLYGLANASSSVAIKIDDVTYSATANKDGAWSTYLSNLTYDIHKVLISSTGQTGLDFNLTISSASTTVTPTATPTSVSTKSSTLPSAGTTENTFLIAALALFSIGLGLAVKYRD